jgi:thiosulfate/3-mercaptopyruvate sulfurtransferase
MFARVVIDLNLSPPKCFLHKEDSMPRRPDRQVYVSVEWLAEHLADEDLRIIDARYAYPNEPLQGDAMYARGHIPGAVFVHWRNDLSVNTPPVPNLLLGPAAFATKMGQLGVDADTTVVVYDVGNVIWAARIWWALRYYGHNRVYVLDGGAAAWQAAGKPWTTTVEPPPAKTFVSRLRPHMRASREQVRAAIDDSDSLIIETRREASLQEGGGTVKNAYWLPSTTVFAPQDDYQTLIPEAELDRYLAEIGADQAPHLVAT